MVAQDGTYLVTIFLAKGMYVNRVLKMGILSSCITCVDKCPNGHAPELKAVILDAAQ